MARVKNEIVGEVDSPTIKPKVYVIKAYNVKKQQPVVVRPCEDRTGRLYTGQGKSGYFELLTEEEKRSLPIVIDHMTKVLLEDGKVLKEDDPIDSQNIPWVLKHPYLTQTYMETGRPRDAVFYVEDPEIKANLMVNKDKNITRAKAKMYDASSEVKIKITKALGNIGAEAMSISSIEEYLSYKCEDNPELILSLLEPKSAKKIEAMGLFEDLKRFNIVRKYGAVFRFGGQDGTILGQIDQDVIDFLNDPKNEETVIAMMRMVESNKN